jgi:hypothetical protein
VSNLSVSLGSTALSGVDRTLGAAVVLPTQLDVMLLTHEHVYSTLVDTGAEVSFADLPLVLSWGVPIVPPTPGGKISLAHAGVATDRSGSVELDTVALFPCSDRRTVSLRHPFELLPIHGAGKDYHFIIGRDLIPIFFLPVFLLPICLHQSHLALR